MLKIINSKSVSKSERGDFSGKMWKQTKFIRILLLHLDVIERSSNKKELFWIKTNTEKKVDKVLSGKIFILISFKRKVFTHINSRQMWMNFNTFPEWKTNRLCDCAIRYDRLV